MLVRFDCSCVGYRQHRPDSSVAAWVIKPCDGDGYRDPEVSIGVRADLELKGFTPLTVEETDALFQKLGGLANDGDCYQRIQALLRIPRRV